MLERDWSHVSEAEDYLSIPPGEYRLDVLSLSSGRAILVGGVRVETEEE